MADETIDQKVNAPPQEEKKEAPKKVSTLESVVNETFKLVGDTAKLGLAVGLPATQAALFPFAARDTAILAGATAAADATTARKRGEKYTIGDLAKSSAVGTLMTVPIVTAYNLMNKIPLDSALGYLGRAAAFGGLLYPLYFGLYQPLDYIIKNMSFKGLGKYLKENYWHVMKKAYKTLFPFGLANLLFAPPALQIPISAFLSYLAALFGAPKKGEVPAEKKRDPTPYYKAASSYLCKLGSGIFNAPYNIGRALYELAKPVPKAPVAPKAPAPTGQPATQQA